MSDTLGTIRGQFILDVRQAIQAYTDARLEHLNTVTALSTGAGALTNTGLAIASVGAGMVAGLAAAVNASAEFEREISYAGAVAGASAADLDRMREAAMQLGADTIYSADEIAVAFTELSKAGVGVDDMIGGIGEAVANLGAAANMPLDTAATILMSAVQTFQLGAEDAVRVADQLAGAANASILDVEDLGVSLRYAGGVASSIGVPFEDLNTALAILGQYGIRGSTAGTSLRRILLSLTPATAGAATTMQELGIITEDGANAFYNADGSAKSLAEIFQILHDATAGLSQEQRVAALNSIFQNRALSSAIALAEGGAGAFTEMSAAINDTSAMEVAGNRLDNLSGDLEILRGNIDTLMISTGSGFQPFARSVVQGVTAMLQAFMDLDPGVQQTILTIAAVIGGILLFVGTAGIFAGSVMNMLALAIQLRNTMVLVQGAYLAFKGALVAGQGVMTAFTAAKGAAAAAAAAQAGAMGAATAATGAQTVATGTATGVQWGFNAALLANPIVLIVTLILALVAGLIYFFTQTELGQEVWANFTQFLEEAWTNIVNFATDVWNNLASFFTDLWNNITSTVETVWNNVSNFIVNIPNNIVQGWMIIGQFFLTLWNDIWNNVVTFFTNIGNFITSIPDHIVAFFQVLPSMIGYALGFLLGTIARFFLEIGMWLVTNVPLIINNVVTFFSELPGRIAEFFSTLWNNLVTWWNNLSVQIVLWAYNVIMGAIQWFQELPGRIADFFSTLWNNLVTWWTTTQAAIANWAYQTIMGAIQWFQQLPERIRQFFSDVYNNITNFMTDAWNNAINLAQDIYNGIRDGILGLPDLVSGIFNNVVGAVKNAITGAFNAVRDFAAGMWEGFQDGLGIHSPSYIEWAMWDIMDVVNTETDNLAKQVRVMQGLGNGISEMGENMGFGFGAKIDQDLVSLQKAMETVSSMRDELADTPISASGLSDLSRANMSATLRRQLALESNAQGAPVYVAESDMDRLAEKVARAMLSIRQADGRSAAMLAMQGGI